MPELKGMPVKMQRPSFSSTLSRHSNKLILGTIIILGLTTGGCAAGRKSIKIETIATQISTSTATVRTEPKLVPAESQVYTDGQETTERYELREDGSAVKYYYNGVYYGDIVLSKMIDKVFSGKFTNRESILGNISMMIKGIDGKGNYGYILILEQNTSIEKTPLIFGFKTEILESGVEVKCIFDEKKNEWKISYPKDGVENMYVFSEDEKDIDITSKIYDLYTK